MSGRVNMQDLTRSRFRKQTFSADDQRLQTPTKVRAYLHLDRRGDRALVRENDRLLREVTMLRDDLEDHSNRERILKDTLLSAQKVAEDLITNARKEGRS
jgi:cell division septum initiation protein DivIVA